MCFANDFLRMRDWVRLSEGWGSRVGEGKMDMVGRGEMGISD